MSTPTTTPANEAKAKAAEAKAKAKAEADEARKAKAAEREAERVKKEQEKAEAKAKKEADLKAAKDARVAEQVAKVAAEGGVAIPEKGSGPDGQVLVKDIREIVKAKKAEERANRPKKAPLTLSQRRALLKLGSGPVDAKSNFNRLPLDYLVSVNLAQVGTTSIEEPFTKTVSREVTEGEGDKAVTKTVKEKVEDTRTVEVARYTLTPDGEQRVKDINPKWLTWKPSKDDAPAEADAA